MTPFIIISAIICILIVFPIICNLYEPIYSEGYSYSRKIEKYDRIKVPLYCYIIAIIICNIPIINIMGTVIFIWWYIYKYWEDNWIIKGPIGKIGKFLSKPL